MEGFYKFIISYSEIIIFFLAVLVYLGEANYKKYNRFFKYGYFVILLLFVFILFGDNLFAKWWVIDDHELFRFMGDYEKKVGIKDFWDIALNKSEVGAFGKSARYRPSYFFLRTVELILWKDNPFFWYLFRLLILFLFVTAIYLFISKYLSYATSFLFVLWVFSYNYWGDIFSRMGPAEIYGTLGFTLSFFAIKSKIEDRVKNAGINFLLYFGIMIMMGAKENFLYFFLISIYFFVVSVTNKSYKKELIGFFISSAYFVFIVLSLLFYFSNSTKDIYGNSTNLGSRLNLFGKFLSLNQTKFIILFFVLVTITLLLNYFRRKSKINFKKQFFYILFFSGYYLLNFLFYNGDWPKNMRYDFPGILTYQLVVFFLIITLYLLLLKRSQLIYFNIAFILFLSLSINITAMKEIKNSSSENKRRTIEFTEFLNTQLEILKVKPNRKIFLLVNQSLDYEPVFSYEIFLNYHKIPNKKFIVINSENKFPDPLFLTLSKLSSEGNDVSLQPFREKEYENSDCVFYTFSDLATKNFGQSCNSKEILTVPF